jgi:hypothetical protein
VQPVVAGAAQGDDITRVFVAKSVVATVMQVAVAERPRCVTHSADGLAVVALDPLRPPLLAPAEPVATAHPLGVGNSAHDTSA